MNQAPAWQTLVYLFAGGNAMMLALALMSSPRLTITRGRLLLAAILAVIGVLLTVFAALQAGWLNPSRSLLVVNRLLELLLPALVFNYTLIALNQKPISWAYLPPAAFIGWVLIVRDSEMLWRSYEMIVPIFIAYTAAATVNLIRSRPRLASWPSHLAWLLGALWLLHGTQIAFLLARQQGWLFDAIPITGAAFVLLLAWRVLVDPLALRRRSKRAVDASSNSEALEEYMATEKPHLDARLDNATLAEGFGVSQRTMSEMLRENGGFYDYVNRWRVREAASFLVDPKEQRTSIEAISMMAGFRSRSTFYECFRRETGTTPAAYRQRPRGSST